MEIKIDDFKLKRIFWPIYFPYWVVGWLCRKIVHIIKNWEDFDFSIFEIPAGAFGVLMAILGTTLIGIGLWGETVYNVRMVLIGGFLLWLGVLMAEWGIRNGLWI